MAEAYERRYGMQVRIARFQNCYGPEGTWTGGREKAPAAMCRKIAEIEDGGTIDVWGDGSAVRSYTYVSDMVDGIYLLTHSELHGAVNIGCPQYVTVDELANTAAEVAGKRDHHPARRRPGGRALAQLQQRAHLLARLDGQGGSRRRAWRSPTPGSRRR